MTAFDRAIASRVAAFLAGQHCIVDVSTALGVDVVYHTYPEVGEILGAEGFQRPAEAWAWIDERLSAHRVTMGEIQCQLMARRFVQKMEDDGA